MREFIGEGDIRELNLDVLDHLIATVECFNLPLMLMQQRDRIDQRQVLRVIAPSARAVIEEREGFRVRIDDRERSQEPLRVLMQLPG